MPDKAVISPPANQWALWSIPILHWRVGLLTVFVLLGMVVVWSIDGCTVRNLIQAWKYRQDYLSVRPNFSLSLKNSTFTTLDPSHSYRTHLDSGKNPIKSVLVDGYSSWISSELEPNLTSNLIARWSARGGEPCKDSKTVNIAIPGLDGREVIELSAGDVHEFGFQALDELGKPHCLGGDYFETDLSGDSWKSRPLVRDFNNGSYSISLQVHPDFDGVYNLTIILLYRHFEGLKFTPWRFSYDRMLRNVTIRFYKSGVQIKVVKIATHLVESDDSTSQPCLTVSRGGLRRASC